ncbi:DgyrCDS6608 [Dimorphilus gyrociliatus]|uniref:DgyrCDS6608 n=1 Tax=Dimorphilus gyrociliatus TaxID=2664684 RepID=A0A7I8VR99_9ANNE|nr:DgyrCDS6608 [Dimorphilus gyrociliatus]
MKRILCCVLFAITFIVILEIVYAKRADNNPIKCYQCNSFYDKGCSDFFDNMTYPLRACPMNATMCRKIIQETYFEGRWDIRYIRQCALLGEVGTDEGRWCKERVGTFRVKVKYCHCDNKDGCNEASRMNYNISMLGISLLLIMILTRLLR